MGIFLGGSLATVIWQRQLELEDNWASCAFRCSCCSFFSITPLAIGMWSLWSTDWTDRQTGNGRKYHQTNGRTRVIILLNECSVESPPRPVNDKFPGDNNWLSAVPQVRWCLWPPPLPPHEEPGQIAVVRSCLHVLEFQSQFIVVAAAAPPKLKECT